MKTEKNTELVRNEKGQFTAGNQEGNRNGRPPKNKHIPDILRQIGEELVGDEDITRLESLCRKVFEHAEKGIRWAVEWVADRLEGRPFQAEISVAKDLPQGFDVRRIPNEYEQEVVQEYEVNKDEFLKWKKERKRNNG